MFCKAVKDSYFKLSSPNIFSNCYPNWFDCRFKDFLSLLLDMFHKFIDHHDKKLQINWPDKPTPIDHLNYWNKNTVLQGVGMKEQIFSSSVMFCEIQNFPVYSVLCSNFELHWSRGLNDRKNNGWHLWARTDLPARVIHKIYGPYNMSTAENI